MKNAKQILNDINEYWFVREPLLFDILTSHTLEENKQMEIMFRTGKKKIQYNPVLVEKSDYEQIESLLRREIYRILLKHPYERVPENPKRAALAKASNHTIFEHCENPKNNFSQTKRIDPEVSEYKLPENSCYEEYYQILKHLIPDPPAGSFGSGNQNSGSTGEDLKDNQSLGQIKREERNRQAAQSSELWSNDDEVCDEIDEKIQKAQKSNKWGSVPSDIKELISAIKKIVFPYEKVLNQFKTSIIKDTRTLTRTKPNRRYGFDYMGSKYSTQTKLLVAVDVSGSILTGDIENFFSIINRFFKYGVTKIDVITFDVIIQQEFTLKKACPKIRVQGRGGTSFQPAINHFEKSDYDGMIIFTDGYAEKPVIRKKGNVLWVLNNVEAKRYTWLSELKKNQITVIKDKNYNEKNYFY